MNEAPEVLECGHPESEHSSITRGYGTMPNGDRHCYACCANTDRADMIATGRATLYLTSRDRKEGDKYEGPSDPNGKVWEATNWPGSLRFRVGHPRKGRHNMARVRYDVWFAGPDGKSWHGAQFGDNTQILHCRRVNS